MKIQVKFFATFKELFEAGVSEIELESGSNIQALLDILCDSPPRRRALFDGSGKLKPYVKILKKGRHIEFLNGLSAPLEEGDVISIFPPVGGG